MNLDVKNEIVEAAKAAISNGNVEEFVNQMLKTTENYADEIRADYEELKNVTDKTVLASRGYYDLTQNEKAFYDSMVNMVKNQSVTNPAVAIPEETFNRIFDDLTTNHPLLTHVSVLNTKSIVGKTIVNTGITGVAQWGELCAEIKDEIKSAFAFRSFEQHKLSAFMEVCKTLLDLGHTWLDRYVRLCLGEAIALALEDAILNGTGESMPLGLGKVIAAPGASQARPAADKQAITLTSLSAEGLKDVAVALTKQGTRALGKMIMVVNPVDYYGVVIPATRIMNAEGRWVEFVPYPIEFVVSVKQATGKATIFVDRKYTLVLGLGRDGKLETSSEYKFYEDLVCYKIKLVGDGTPADNDVAIVADITGLKAAAMNVNMLEAITVNTPEANV